MLVRWKMGIAVGVVGLLAVAMQPEEPRIVVPCEVVEVYDGDTLTVRVSADVRVRLLDCWAPEMHTRDLAEKQRGVASRDALRGLARPGDRGLLTVPLRDVSRTDDLFTMGRLLGRVSIKGRDLSESQVAEGHATKDK